MERKCKVCGASYNTNYSCERGRSWRTHTDTAEHYYIMTVLMTYQADHDAKQAYAALRKRGVNLRETSEYVPSVQALFAEINARVNGVTKPKKAVEETKKVSIAAPENDVTV